MKIQLKSKRRKEYLALRRSLSKNVNLLLLKSGVSFHLFEIELLNLFFQRKLNKKPAVFLSLNIFK